MLKYKYSRTSTPEPALRSSMMNLNSSFKGSTNSLASDGSSTLMRKKKGKAPAPPTQGVLPRTPELASKVRMILIF